MLAVILVVVVGTIRLIGSNANNAFSAVREFDPVRPLGWFRSFCPTRVVGTSEYLWKKGLAATFCGTQVPFAHRAP
jgi:hypothetical protein